MRLTQAAVVEEILIERGPSTAEDVGPELAARGATTAKNPVATARSVLRWHPGIVELADGRWVARAGLMDGAVLTHHVSVSERERCCLRMDPDLSILAPLVEAGTLRSPMGEVQVVADWIHDAALDPASDTPDRFLALPYGVGRRLEPGTLVGVTIRGGTLDIVPLESATPVPASMISIIEATAERLLPRSRHPYRERSLTVERLLTEAAIAAPELLPGLTEPVGALLRRAGLVTHRDLVGLPLTDWRHLGHDAAVWHLVDRWEADARRSSGDEAWWWAESTAPTAWTNLVD